MNLTRASGGVSPQTKPQSRQAKPASESIVPPRAVKVRNRNPRGRNTAGPELSAEEIIPVAMWTPPQRKHLCIGKRLNVPKLGDGRSNLRIGTACRGVGELRQPWTTPAIEAVHSSEWVVRFVIFQNRPALTNLRSNEFGGSK